MSNKILLGALIVSASFTLIPQSNPPYIRTYPSTIIVTKSKPPKPHKCLLDAIEDGSFSRFRRIMKKYYTNKAQLPEINVEQLSKKTVFDIYNTFPLIKAGIAKANKKQLKYLRRVQTKLFDAMLITKGLTASTLATFSSCVLFEMARHDFYFSFEGIMITGLMCSLYYYGLTRLYNGINYKACTKKKIKENELISDCIESH